MAPAKLPSITPLHITVPQAPFIYCTPYKSDTFTLPHNSHFPILSLLSCSPFRKNGEKLHCIRRHRIIKCTNLIQSLNTANTKAGDQISSSANLHPLSIPKNYLLSSMILHSCPVSLSSSLLSTGLPPKILQAYHVSPFKLDSQFLTLPFISVPQRE
jgi:hypothetical protein